MIALPRPSERIAEALRAAASVAEVARVGGIPKRSVSNVVAGRVPSVDRADQICRALGIALTIGVDRESAAYGIPPPRPGWSPAPLTRAPPPARAAVAGGAVATLLSPASSPALEPVSDRRLAELLARLADHWEAGTPDDQARLVAAIDVALRGTGERERGPRYAALSSGSDGGS